MLLIITLSGDPAVDLVVDKISIPVFRLNVDRFRDYEFTLRPEAWEVVGPGPHRISSETGTRCWWWKPLITRSSEDPLIMGEVRASIEEIYSWFARRHRLVGNSPLFERRIGKIYQAEVASNYFVTPASVVLWGQRPVSVLTSNLRWVAKSQAMEMTADGRGLFVTEVDLQSLDANGPWFLQPLVESPTDVTVQVAGDDLFAFQRSRSGNATPDWRFDYFAGEATWESVSLGRAEENRILEYCRALGVNWGRIDLLRVDDRLVFLELNPNGQWGFLDPADDSGLVTGVARFLSESSTHGHH